MKEFSVDFKPDTDTLLWFYNELNKMETLYEQTVLMGNHKFDNPLARGQNYGIKDTFSIIRGHIEHILAPVKDPEPQGNYFGFINALCEGNDNAGNYSDRINTK